MNFIFLSLFFCFSSFAHQGKVHKPGPPTQEPIVLEKHETKAVEVINQRYKESIKAIFIKSCFDCHSDKTSFPWYYELPYIKSLIDDDIKEARSHLDFSKDFPFLGHGNALEDLESIKMSLMGGSMPPLNYYIMNPGSRLSDTEKRQVLEWIEFSKKALSKEK
ncbi:MAG: hypothetical protein ACJAT2_000729 [Bacteriovoracaceae bacterium]|jgi:hypothetical protein